MITSPGLLTTSHDDSVSVALSQNTTGGDVKDKPPSPHPVGWTPQIIFKEGEHHLRNQRALQSKWNTISCKGAKSPLTSIQLNSKYNAFYIFFSSLRLTVIKILFVDFRQRYKTKPTTNSGLSLCIVNGRISQYANKHNIFDFRLRSVFQSPQQEPLQQQ